MSRTRTPQPEPFPTVELTRDIPQKYPTEPVGWLVENNGGGWSLFRWFEDAEGFVDGTDYPIYPLYASHRVVNKVEPRREA